MAHTSDPEISRRNFLRWFSGKSVAAVGNAVAAAAPLLSGNLAKPQKLPMPELSEAQTRCPRCYAPLSADQTEGVCPNCREAETKHRSLLNDLFKERA